MYAVKECFLTLQGEGANAGRVAVFIRFAGCNLWSGREKDRDSGCSAWCDTDFVGTAGDGGGRYERSLDVAMLAYSRRPKRVSRGDGLCVLTGGEPALQVDADLVRALHEYGFEVAIETNGTKELPTGVDWVCVSPKTATLAVTQGNELKVAFPQPHLDMEWLASLNFDHFFVQPIDGPSLGENTAAAIAFCMANPQWRLSTQMHKTIGVR